MFPMPFPKFWKQKGFLERKFYKNELHCYGAILYSSIDDFLLKTK
jgi:hypothetical protein